MDLIQCNTVGFTEDDSEMMLSTARTYVNNQMPIRLLAFDKDGSNIQLIGRNEVITSILPGVFSKIADHKFQRKWAKAKNSKASILRTQNDQRRLDKMKELLMEIVKESANYAILSHTWMNSSPGDVTFHDWNTREHNPLGNAKIVEFCKAAARDHNITLGWIDSVCINKESSSELDESIRSMYKWYRRASVCITFLSKTTNIRDAHGDSWFTRGWTLQELLAPLNNVFYSQDWSQLGSLGSNGSVIIPKIIKKACGITREELKLSREPGGIEQIPLSRRMQMACGRQVTREEDTAYSLMGILGVEISVAYGEGSSHAFFRLIRELLNTKRDVIDLFNRGYNRGEPLVPSSLESYRPQDDDNRPDGSDGSTTLDYCTPVEPIILTHLGVRISLLLVPWLVIPHRSDAVENYVAKGALSAKVTVDPPGYPKAFSPHSEKYLLCDSRLYSGNLDHLPDTHRYHICMTGIVNFGVDTTGHILLPEQCLALKLIWSGLWEGNMTPGSGDVTIQSGKPLNFKLESKKGSKIPKAELEEHGVQLVSLYL